MVPVTRIKSFWNDIELRPFNTKMEYPMPRGDKSSYSDKQKRMAQHIEEATRDAAHLRMRPQSPGVCTLCFSKEGYQDPKAECRLGASDERGNDALH